MARARVWARRVVVVGVVALQATFVVRAYHTDHREFGFQMFPEASDWRAEVVRVTTDGRRVPVTEPWDGYRWEAMVTSRGLAYPHVRRHADAGLENQLAFLDAALDWVADNTPRDTDTRYLEATVTAWPNGRGPETVVLRSEERALP